MTGPVLGTARAALRAGSFLFAALFVTTAFAAEPVKYTLAPEASLLRFTFEQAGAKNTGRFGKFDADVVFSADNLAASSLDVTVDVASLDSGDEERDQLLKTDDLFDVAKYPKAHFVAKKITLVGAGRYEATGKLTIRNVTRDLKLPITFQTKEEKGQSVGLLTGRVTLKRLDYGVGQGEWKSTEWVKDEVLVSFSLKLLPAS